MSISNWRKMKEREGITVTLRFKKDERRRVKPGTKCQSSFLNILFSSMISPLIRGGVAGVIK